MNVIGLGNGGRAIADLFSQYPEYKIYKIDTNISGKNCFRLPSCSSIEEYEEKVPPFKALSKIKGETVFIVCGGGNVSGAVLALLEKIKHTMPTVLYVKPDASLSPPETMLKDKVVYGILQEYARSGLLKKIILVSNSKIEELLGGLSIVEYYDSINKVIVSTLHMVNYLLTTDSVFGKMSPTREIDRISTIGVYDLEEGQENYLFNLNLPTQKIFLYAIKQEDLTTDKNLIKIIQQQTKNSYSGTELDISYKVNSTNYDTNFVYIVLNSNLIQN